MSSTKHLGFQNLAERGMKNRSPSSCSRSRSSFQFAESHFNAMKHYAFGQPGPLPDSGVKTPSASSCSASFNRLAPAPGPCGQGRNILYLVSSHELSSSGQWTVMGTAHRLPVGRAGAGQGCMLHPAACRGFLGLCDGSACCDAVCVHHMRDSGRFSNAANVPMLHAHIFCTCSAPHVKEGAMSKAASPRAAKCAAAWKLGDSDAFRLT